MLKVEKPIKIESINKNSNSSTKIFTDPVRFRQVMNNLIGNAIKYTEHGYVRFGYIRKNRVVEIFVEDTGIGISEKDQQTIFEYFYKVEDDANRIFRGTGIGLSICKKLVGLMESEIKVTSKVNAGTRFSFLLPVAD